MPYAVQNLIVGRGEPTSVSPTDSAEKALALMIEHEYSQLPVVNESKRPLGMVTHGSILRALSNFGVSLQDLHVRDAIVTTNSYRPEDDLFDLLDRLKETNAVLIVDADDQLIGIVTSYDSTEYFRQRAEDLMWVEDIEITIKELVLTAFTDDMGNVDEKVQKDAIEKALSSKHRLMGRYRNALRHYLKLRGEEKPEIDESSLERSFSHLDPKEKTKDFDDLTLYEYAELLLQGICWDLYSPFFDLSPVAIRNLLDGVRNTRNDLAHFRGELSATQRDQLRFCTEWLGRHQAEQLTANMVKIPVDLAIYKAPVEAGTAMVAETAEAYETIAITRESIIPTDEVLGPTHSRYAPLAIWLQSRPSREHRAKLSFEKVEDIIKGELPPYARTHRGWWANDSVGHVQSQQWLEVGWRVAQINITEGRVTFARIIEREAAYISFFSALQNDVRDTTDFPLRELRPDGHCWQTAASLPEDGAKRLHFVFSFSRGKRFRVELYVDTGDKEKNKLIFDRLEGDRDKVHETLGEELGWERLSEKRASRIAWYRPGFITNDEDTLANLRAWAVDAMVRFYDTLAEPAVQALAEVG